jgi:hypothetical protein
MKPAKQENHVSIAETIIQMQESREHYLSFVEIAHNVIFAAERLRIKMHKPKYEVGDIVYLSPFIQDFNWKLTNYLGRPFIIVQLPVDTQKFKTYTLRLLDDPSNEECWEDLAFHESFLQKRT